MDKIESIRKDTRHTFLLQFTSGSSISISEDLLVKYGFHKGMELEEQAWEKLRQDIAIDSSYQQGLHYLSYQLRSKKELRDYLKGKMFTEKVIGETIIRLEKLCLLDDQAYADSYVRTIMKTQEKGPLSIRRSLSQKGVEAEQIDQALQQYSLQDEEKTVKKLITKLQNRYRNKSHKEMKQKVQLNLIQKGFTKDLIQQILSDSLQEKDDDEEKNLLRITGDKLWRKNHQLPLEKKKLKVMQALFRKGFDYQNIQQYIEEKAGAEENE